MNSQFDIRAIGVMARDAYPNRVPGTETLGRAGSKEGSNEPKAGSNNNGRANANTGSTEASQFAAKRREVIRRCA